MSRSSTTVAATTATAGHMLTTYAQLTHRAARRIAQATVEVAPWQPATTSLREPDVAAHRDLVAALAHLGHTLARVAAGDGPEGSTPRRVGGPSARSLRSIERYARARDWENPRPTEGPGREFDRAAFLIRAAADLWATHQSGDGQPRSPEASRMRHPSMLGAATREWRALVALAADLEAHIESLGGCADGCADGRSAANASQHLENLQPLRRSILTPMEPSAHEGLRTLTVARPGLRRGQPPIVELGQRIARLRQLAWSLARAGSAPVAVHGNMAVIAVLVNQAAASAHRAVRDELPPGLTRSRHCDAEARATADEALWQQVADQVRRLRTPHRAAHAIQVERLDIHGLLGRVVPTGDAQALPEVAWELTRIAGSFTEIAALCAQGLRIAHERGDILLVGRAIPTEALPRRPDLLRARLCDEVIPAPSLTIDRLELTYRALARGHERTKAAPDSAPPAA